MATVTFINLDGKRVEVTAADLTTEHRCDKCGELVDPAALTPVLVTVVTGTNPAATAKAEGHQSCMITEAPRLAAVAARRAVPF